MGAGGQIRARLIVSAPSRAASPGPGFAGGVWLDSYDYPALVRDVLRPFGPEGSRRYRPAAHDLRTDAVLDLPWRTAAPGPSW